MERLLEDASKISGKDFLWGEDGAGYGFSEIVEAIHVIQEEMGITGTTAAEASQTISGSVAAAKAALENLLTAIASDDMDVGVYIDRFVESLVTAADNVLPRAEQILQGVSSLISGMAPVISTMLPQIINGFLPGLLSSAVELVTTLLSNLVSILPDLLANGVLPIALMLVDSLLTMLPDVMAAALQLVEALVLGLAQAAPTLIPAAIDTIIQLCNALLAPEGLAAILNAALVLIQALADGILASMPMLSTAIPEIVNMIATTIIQFLPVLLPAAYEIVWALIQGLGSMYPELIGNFLNMLMGLIDEILAIDWIGVGIDMLTAVATGILGTAANLLESAMNAFAPMTEWLYGLVGLSPEWGRDMIQGLIDGIRDFIPKLKQAAKDAAKAISDFLHFSRPEMGPLRDYESWMPDMIGGMVKGIEDNKYKLSNAVAGLASDMSANMAIAANGGGTAAVSGGNNTFNFNIYGAEGQDVRELADIVMERMQAAVSRKDAVFV